MQHFESGFPCEQNPDPISADPYLGDRSTKKRPPPKVRNLTFPVQKKRRATTETVTATPQQCEDEVPHEAIEPMNTETGTQTSPKKAPVNQRNRFSKPTSIKCDSCGHYTRTSKSDIKLITKDNFIQTIQKNDANCFHYTGIPKVALLQQIFIWIEPLACKIKLWDGQKKFTTTGRSAARKRKALTSFEEYCLTLVRIRRGYDVELLSHLFGISKSHVCRILPSWINFLAKCLKPLIKWPSEDVVRANLPHSFRSFPRTRCIIDCTEIYVEKAFRPAAQRATWSSYKHANTFKLLVGIMPSGAITFLSKLYSGSISDQAIVKQSKFVDNIEEGDDVMADRGFNVRHLLLRKKATLNIPSFSFNKRLSAKAVKRSRRIASVRIHVERAICRMKTFRILSGIIPIKLRFQLNQIITIIGALCNLQERLAK